MDYEALLLLSEEEREIVMRNQLGEEKCKLIDKYDLYPNNRLYWERRQAKYPTQEYFSHKMALKTSIIGIIFHINRLCYAKTKYFQENWDEYVPCIFKHDEGFVETDIYNMEYIKQRHTNIVLDLRELAKIHWISEFRELCKYLEESLEKVKHKPYSSAV